MGHREVRESGFDSEGVQHNIMAFVGNGFDIQALHDYKSPLITTYASFYHFLKLRSFNPTNPILQEMETLSKQPNRNDWSDIEGLVGNLLADNRFPADALIGALRELQGEFAEFLDLAVPSSLLSLLGADSMTRSLAVTSLSRFLADLGDEDYGSLRFPSGLSNFDIHNFVFVNYNYTPLLDDYIYLDQRQFDPRPYKWADRNFRFEGNPNKIPSRTVRPGDTFSSYVMTEVIHPHGHQSIPRSLLFGIDEPGHETRNDDRSLRLAKPFWAQNERRYQHLFTNTELFIVFGCSLGESDRWWWRNIAESLGQKRFHPGSDGRPGKEYRPELILYWFNGVDSPLTEDRVKEKFLHAAGYIDDGEIKFHIHVVLHHGPSGRVWLNTARDSAAKSP